jgi:hypothetical protein
MELDALCTRCGRHYAGPAEGCPSCDGPLGAGNADFTLAEWAEAFKAQNRNLLRRVGAADDLSVYVELDLG